jgi:hypothetical protein
VKSAEICSAVYLFAEHEAKIRWAVPIMDLFIKMTS